MTIAANRSVDNPFCTSRVRPGALRFRFPHGESIEALLQRWEQHQRRGAIVGPHGTGKSTLLSELLPHLQARGEVMRHALHDGERRLPREVWRQLKKTRNSDATLVIDGYEQLAWWEAWRLHRWIRRNDIGLIVTRHRAGRWPEIFRTDASETLAVELVAELTADAPLLILPADVHDAWSPHAGNVRETLFALYDVYEVRKSGPVRR